jgi:hypothetical protein
MKRGLGSTTTLVFALAAALSAPVNGQAQPPKARPRAAKAPPARTAWGTPDLQGTWTNTTTTPFERPDDLAGKAVLTEAERESRNTETAKRLSFDNPDVAGSPGAYNEFWMDRGRLTHQTSLVIEPADGKIPAMTEAGKQRVAVLAASRKAHPADSWEDRSAYDRCITRGIPGAMVPGFYNHNYQIFQTKDYVAILVEMIHEARIIPLDGRPFLNDGIRQWTGNSRGHWEGDTLVVETRNLTDKVFEARPGVAFSSGGNLRLIERFKRIDADTLDYQFTVNDPTVYTAPWTVSTPMARLDAPIFEYACHEGNYAMPGILSAARSEEKGGADKK